MDFTQHNIQVQSMHVKVIKLIITKWESKVKSQGQTKHILSQKS